MNNAKPASVVKNLSLTSADLRRKMMSTFAISSILPILIAFYLNYDKVLGGSRRISVFLFIATILSLMGLFLFIDIIKSLLRGESL